MMRGRRLQTSLLVFLAALLLPLQALALAHELDFDAHEAGQTCELCLHLAVLDHSVISLALRLDTPRIPPASPSVALPAPVRRSPEAFSARAPPFGPPA